MLRTASPHIILPATDDPFCEWNDGRLGRNGGEGRGEYLNSKSSLCGEFVAPPPEISSFTLHHSALFKSLDPLLSALHGTLHRNKVSSLFALHSLECYGLLSPAYSNRSRSYLFYTHSMLLAIENQFLTSSLPTETCTSISIIYNQDARSFSSTLLPSHYRPPGNAGTKTFLRPRNLRPRAS